MMQILELRLAAPDLAAQRDFYAETLGLPADLAGGVLTIQVGATRLIFTPAVDIAPCYHFAFNVPENQFAAAKAWISARAPLLTDPEGVDEFDFAPWNAHAFYFADAAGNILEGIARHDLANASDRPFDADSLLSISEIGLPGPSVAALAETLQVATGVPHYSGDRESFAALGDPRGLFIVVPFGHPWLPDLRVKAAAHPVTATVRAGKDKTGVSIPGLPYVIQVV